MIDDTIRNLLSQKRRIAVVGLSPKPERASYGVARFLRDQGHDVVGVNPGHAGSSIDGIPVVAALADVSPRADIVDVFRNSEDAGGVVEEAIAHGADAVWMQLGVVNEAAAERGRAAGLTVIMDRCPKIEIPRLGIGKVA